MEIRTRLPSPQSNIIQWPLILSRIVILFGILVWWYWNDQNMKNDDTILSTIASSFRNTRSMDCHLEHLDCPMLKDREMWWLPRIAASSLTFYIGICCGYVGLAHFGWIHWNNQGDQDYKAILGCPKFLYKNLFMSKVVGSKCIAEDYDTSL